MSAPAIQGQQATCKNCGGRIVYDHYRNVGGYEPDYDPADDPMAWRHITGGTARGYGACGTGGTYAEPGPFAFLDRLRAANVARCERWHGPDTEPWSLADWSNAAAGEMGEAANVVKKIRRHETGTGSANNPEADALDQMLADEIADTIIYLDLLAAQRGISLEEAITSKFDAVSVREGYPERLAVEP